jgi:hypothetical protein
VIGASDQDQLAHASQVFGFTFLHMDLLLPTDVTENGICCAAFASGNATEIKE